MQMRPYYDTLTEIQYTNDAILAYKLALKAVPWYVYMRAAAYQLVNVHEKRIVLGLRTPGCDALAYGLSSARGYYYRFQRNAAQVT